MESGDLRIFQAVAREGSVTKAARSLGYVQSNITARIRHLENELGTTLFTRHNRGMDLSGSGKLLLQYADKIIGLLDDAALALSASDEPGGSLRIGSTQTAAAVRLPSLLTAYYGRYPSVSLSVATGHTQYLIEQVLRYELDGAFIGSGVDHPELAGMPTFEEELVVVTSPAVPDLEAALARPILVFTVGCSYRDVLQAWVRSKGLSNPVTMEFGTLDAILGGVTAGLGISLMPLAVIRRQIEEGRLRAYPLPELYGRMTTHFITRKDSFVSSALREFIAMLPESPAASL
ncbi:LysR family transcriptional regulator [Paenibacillus methanolicus]|uniref:DNA-binding transcriptional LysR family regulator n=1 Tax=Paenibacillus methanolicus TaxID=582686 RepID=A0A5S5BZ77_9BACL|nr:LysR family transcriptional regulator [Paenibacillus methanolicus]TYP72481.1 DNA-binding transcriptional LysR family regulator [Paenibacillus methanolicus]